MNIKSIRDVVFEDLTLELLGALTDTHLAKSFGKDRTTTWPQQLKSSDTYLRKKALIEDMEIGISWGLKILKCYLKLKGRTKQLQNYERYLAAKSQSGGFIGHHYSLAS